MTGAQTPEAALCTWCGTEHEAEVDDFCSGDCRQNFDAACLLWGKEQYGCGEVSIWQLDTCLRRQKRRAQSDPASEQVKAPETSVRPDGPQNGAAP